MSDVTARASTGLSDTRLHVPISLRWSDLDAYGHVNNTAMLRLLEEARIEAFWSSGMPGEEPASATAVLAGGPEADTVTLLARSSIEYLLPVPYHRQPLDIQLWLSRLGGASLEVCYEVHPPLGSAADVVYSQAMTTVVLADPHTMRPRRINDVERAAWSPYLGEAVSFSRRG